MVNTYTFKSKTEIKYMIDFPENFDKSKKHPIIFYFHGVGMIGSDINIVVKGCPVRRERMAPDMDFIIVAPQCREPLWFAVMQDLLEFIDHILENDFVDKSRVYLTGASMGGFTSWVLAYLRKNTWAAAVICCAGAMSWTAKYLTHLPVRAIHGMNDKTVPPFNGINTTQAINEKGGRVELILHEDLAHDVWTRTFTDHDTYRWLLNHRLEQ